MALQHGHRPHHDPTPPTTPLTIPITSTSPLPRPRRPPHRPRWWASRRAGVAAFLVLILAVSPVGYSYVGALTASGTDSVAVRTVSWLRDYGAGPAVNVAENWWYARNRPHGTTPDPASLPAPPSTSVAASTTAATGSRPPVLPVATGSPLPGEGVWTPTPAAVVPPDPGAPALATTFFRPEPQAPSVVVGVAWINQNQVRTHLVAGTTDPTPGGAADGRGGRIPPDLRAGLLAAFNSGFKLKDAEGGYAIRGRPVIPLRDGAASLSIDTSGRVDIGQWGRDLGPTPGTDTVRQNLTLIVDRAAPVPGLDANTDHRWGSTRNQLQYTWRSGLGVDTAGNLVYVAGDQLTLADLARALTAAGAVRGMELDIHPQHVTFLRYPSGARSTADGTRLLPGMYASPHQFLAPDPRDFLAVTTPAVPTRTTTAPAVPTRTTTAP